jgi:hypothetical protein
VMLTVVALRCKNSRYGVRTRVTVEILESAWLSCSQDRDPGLVNGTVKCEKSGCHARHGTSRFDQ